MNQMNYKGYKARIEFDAEDRIFVGHIAGIRDIVSFHGDNVDALEQAFHEAVEHYLDACSQRGESPQKPYSGKLMLRIPPEVHAAVDMAAKASGQSINKWAAQALENAARD